MKETCTPGLAQAILADPETGMRWAIRDYAALVRGILRRILPGREDDVEECMADVFVALWRNARHLRDTDTPVRAWLIVTARNTGINRYRALQRRQEIPLTEELAQTLADLPPDPTGAAADLVGALVAAMDPPDRDIFLRKYAMDPPDRDIFLRKYYLLQSGREIAEALGVSVASVDTRLSRGRERLRRQLKEGGYSHA